MPRLTSKFGSGAQRKIVIDSGRIVGKQETDECVPVISVLPVIQESSVTICQIEGLALSHNSKTSLGSWFAASQERQPRASGAYLTQES
jgi:hypothetical protein